jgi:hypothetical protein
VTDDKKPLDQAVEFALYAPIGFALEARRLLPSFIERGKQQVTMAKVVGQFAVTHGQSTAKQKVGKLQDQAESLLGELGLGPQAAATAEEASAAAEAPRASSSPTSADRPEAVATDATPTAPAPAVGDLPISGYDSLAASQVIPRLAGLTSDELDAVEAYETATRGRKTILGKIAQLRAS